MVPILNFKHGRREQDCWCHFSFSYTLVMKSIEYFLEKFPEMIESWNHTNEVISKASTYRHLEHSLQVIQWICKSVGESNPELFSQWFNLTRRLSLTFNRIPRGMVESPDKVRPVWVITKHQVSESLCTANQAVWSLEWVSPHSFFVHEMLGVLDRDQAKQFLTVHTYHHFKIIREIHRSMR